MEERISVKEALDKDIYSIYEENGVKMIKFRGYVYDAENTNENGEHVFNCIELCWCKMRLDEVVRGLVDIDDKQYECKQCCGLLTESEADDYINNYFGYVVFPCEETHAPKRLSLGDVDMNTPCGDYIDI